MSVVAHERLTCFRCQGHGTVVVKACRHSGNCPCGAEEVECWEESCMDGRVACGFCGDRPAEKLVGPDEYCRTCAEAEEAAA